MKNIGLLVLLLVSLEVSAQGVFSNHTNSAIEKVIRDYPNQFKNITGMLLLEHPQTADYQSNIQIPGALSCLIIKSSVARKDATCWKAELLETGSFEEAKTKYKELYNQIRNSIVRIDGEKPYILNGQFEVPNAQKRFHSVVFNMLPSVGQMQKLKVELSLVQQQTSWKINLTVYDAEGISIL